MKFTQVTYTEFQVPAKDFDEMYVFLNNLVYLLMDTTLKFISAVNCSQPSNSPKKSLALIFQIKFYLYVIHFFISNKIENNLRLRSTVQYCTCESFSFTQDTRKKKNEKNLLNIFQFSCFFCLQIIY